MTESKKRITVIGSYNVGLFLTGRKIPQIGETVIGDHFLEGGGGKGSNQIITASKMGALTTFIGCVGDDKYGNDAIGLYTELNIDSSMMHVDRSHHTGISVIFIDECGRNSIMVIPGANHLLSKKNIDDAEEVILSSFIVGFQLENNLDIVSYGINKVHALGVQTLLDPAPAQRLPDELYPCISIIKPNEHEATVLCGFTVNDVESAKEAGRWFVDKGVQTAIVTLGAMGAVLVQKNMEQFFPAIPVNPVDTTGAGDCFSGALMAALADGNKMGQAIPFAHATAALSTMKNGVVNAIPSYDEVVEMLNRNKHLYDTTGESRGL